MVQLSAKDFEERISKGISLVEFDTPWCAPCRTQTSIVMQLEKDFRDRATIATVNIDQSRQIALKMKIQSIPTIIIFKEGREYNRFVGLQNAEKLRRALGSLLER